MDTKEKRTEEIRKDHEHLDTEANSLRANAKNKRNESTRKVNRLWLWLGVLILIFILLWWLWSIGTFENLTGVTNG